jgi:hypothetical protein
MNGFSNLCDELEDLGKLKVRYSIVWNDQQRKK